MASKNIPAKSEDLTRCIIPDWSEGEGDKQKNFHGTVAFWFKVDELSPRRSREMDVYEVTLMPKLRQLMVAQKIIGPDGETLAEDNGLGGLPVGLSLDESRMLFDMNDTAAWAYLKSWSLPDPLPESPAALLDLHPTLYQALIGHAAKITKQRLVTPGFELSDESVENDDSPSGGFNE